MTKKTINELKLNGFVKNSQSILSSLEINELKGIIDKLFSDKQIKINKGSNALVIDNLVGLEPRLDFLLKTLITHESVKSILNAVLGENYKAWQITARRSMPGDNGLYLHQDAPCETGFSFLLSDNIVGDGATAFLPRSHKLSRWARKISWSNVSISSRFLSPFKGEMGDSGFFFNRTWHARLKNESKKTHDVLLISFFPSGVTYESIWDEKSLNKISQSELRILCDQNKTSILNDKKIGNKGNLPYVMELENSSEFKAPKALTIKVVLLHIIFLPIRWLFRIFEKIKY